MEEQSRVLSLVFLDHHKTIAIFDIELVSGGACFIASKLFTASPNTKFLLSLVLIFV